jgi:antitoxin FitA
MPPILIRGLNDDVQKKLRERARRNGQSVQETLRNIIEAALSEPAPRKGLGTAIHELFKDCGLKPGEIQELKGQTIKPIHFD